MTRPVGPRLRPRRRWGSKPATKWGPASITQLYERRPTVAQPGRASTARPCGSGSAPA